MGNKTIRLKSYDQEIERFWSKVKKLNIDECWIWQGGVNQDGYGNFYTNNSHIFAHRFSWECTYGKINNSELRVLHKCDNPPCVNPNHLFLGTQFDNIQDMIIKGRASDKHGEQNAKAKLTEQDVMLVKYLRKEGQTYKEIAKRFSVTESCINHILNGRHWSWINV